MSDSTPHPDATTPLRSDFASDATMQDLVEFFVMELGNRIGAIERAIAADDREALRTLAHQLKGAAGGYGFPSISVSAAALENLLGHDDALVSAARHEIADLVTLCRRALM